MLTMLSVCAGVPLHSEARPCEGHRQAWVELSCSRWPHHIWAGRLPRWQGKAYCFPCLPSGKNLLLHYSIWWLLKKKIKNLGQMPARFLVHMQQNVEVLRLPLAESDIYWQLLGSCMQQWLARFWW